jgi:D-proline reductase (dithiol) PrdB
MEPRGGRVSDGTTERRTFVSYIDRTREYYGAQGYEQAYRWARFHGVPFAPLPKPLAECRVTVITTASPICEQRVRDGVLRGGKEVWSGDASEPPERLFTDDLAWDKETTYTDDVESFLPLGQLAGYVAVGRIGSLASRFHGVPTDYSQRRTSEDDAPEILRRCREDAVDVALLVPL